MKNYVRNQCRKELNELRRLNGLSYKNKIDKRQSGYMKYKTLNGESQYKEIGWLAPDGERYKAHCAHCAEAEYIRKKYGPWD